MHPIQEKIYKIYIENNGKLPTFRELAKILGVASTNTVAFHINQLKKRGEFNFVKEKKAVVQFNIKNILNLNAKPGVFVLIRNKKALHIEESENLKKSLIKIIEDEPDYLKQSIEDVLIAYCVVENPAERINFKNYLIKVFKFK